MQDQYLVSVDQAAKWGVSLLTKCNLNAEQAAIVVKGLISSNLRGVDTHGLVMIRHYARRFTTITTRPIEIVKETETTCLVDAGDNYGILASTIAMNKAIEKAERYGCGVSSVRNSNHFGAAAYYALMAAEKGMLGISTTNAGSRIPPWGGKEAFLGNNPIAIALPGDEYPVILDMALSVVAYQKIVTYAREGWPLPEGWAYDSAGEPTTNHQAALDGMLTPLGGYKGAGLSVMLDLICGAISQNGFADHVLSIDMYDKPRHVGHFFIAVNISNFLPLDVLKSLIAAYSRKFHVIPRKDGVDRLYLPGEIEYEKYKERSKNGFPLSRAAVEQLNEVSDEFGIARLVSVDPIGS
ncbi:MAG: Ldh family oxidoreductase [Treponema sp.]|jgi:LDH2 family malate/lactate/ureidoglycolate dehydrogenase|nr:Ldh family oxidoreductase [Treponema sp.]